MAVCELRAAFSVLRFDMIVVLHRVSFLSLLSAVQAGGTKYMTSYVV
jgi:hypothetical protein